MTFSGTQLTAFDAPLLGVNIDHVATLRNARGGVYPDPVTAAQWAVEAGADIITFHLREDRRHIRDEDVVRMKAEIIHRFESRLPPDDDHPYRTGAWRPTLNEWDAESLDV